MIKLKEERYYICTNLKNNKFKSPEAYSVIENNTPGEVFVDDSNNPRIAIVYSKGMSGYYLLGEVEDKEYFNSIKNKMFFIVSMYTKSLGLKSIEISAETIEGENRITEIFDDASLRYRIRQVYDTCYLEKRKEIEEKFEIYFLTKELNLKQFSNFEYFLKEIIEYWGTIENFYRLGKGTILVINKKVISICYTGSIYKKRVTLNIKTLEEYRLNNYGFNVSYTLIRKLRKEGLYPYLDCDKDNKPMIRLAKKLGFMATENYKCFIVDI